MEVEPVRSVPSPRRPLQAVGATGELAEARAKLREAAPPDRWDAVLAEVSRLQAAERMPPLAALHTVYAKLASGWLPPAR